MPKMLIHHVQIPCSLVITHYARTCLCITIGGHMQKRSRMRSCRSILCFYYKWK